MSSTQDISRNAHWLQTVHWVQHSWEKSDSFMPRRHWLSPQTISHLSEHMIHVFQSSVAAQIRVSMMWLLRSTGQCIWTPFWVLTGAITTSASQTPKCALLLKDRRLLGQQQELLLCKAASQLRSAGCTRTFQLWSQPQTADDREDGWRKWWWR